jgi:hypothetical protein
MRYRVLRTEINFGTPGFQLVNRYLSLECETLDERCRYPELMVG